MNNRERTRAALSYQPYDRLPVVHFGYWRETLQRWTDEGHITEVERRGWSDGNEVDHAVSGRLGFDFNWYTLFQWEWRLFPRLERHRCCGGNDVRNTLFHRSRRAGCALPPINHGLDLCHLLEHLALDLMGGMVPARPWAGITCAYRDPLHRFDLFLECEDFLFYTSDIRSALKDCQPTLI